MVAREILETVFLTVEKLRCFITKENSCNFPNLTNFINELQDKKTYEKISSLIGKDLSNSYVRVEVVCDR